MTNWLARRRRVERGPETLSAGLGYTTSYGATCRFYSAERHSEGLSQANFAENEAWTLRKGVMGNRILLEGRFSNFP